MLSLKNLEKGKKKKTGTTAQSIQQAIASLWLDHKYIIFNAYLFEWESDYFSVNESNYIYEVEIKVTKGDFKKDFKKEGKHLLLETKEEPRKLPNKFWYATPRGLLPSYKIPEYAGLIEIEDTNTGYRAEIIKNAPFLHREEVFEDLKPSLLDKFYHKYRRTEYENYELQQELIELKEKLKNKSDTNEK